MVIFENYKLKIVVLIFAIVIWFMVVTENDYEQVIEVPIVLVNSPQGKVILNDIPTAAKVRIRGSGKSLIALGVSRGARVELDLSGIESEKTFFLRPGHVILARPTGTLSPDEILFPDSVSVRFDDFETKRIAVQPRITARPAAGFTAVGDLRLTPDSVFVSGPKSLVQQVDVVSTRPADYDDVRFNLEETILLSPLPFERLSVDRNSVNAYLNIQMLVEKTMTGIPVRVKNAPKNLKVTVIPSDLSLIVEGGGDLLTQLERDDILAYIDYNRVRLSPSNEFPAVIERPSGISYRDVKPKTFKLVFERTN